MSPRFLPAAVLLACLVSGCATVIHGSKQDVAIISEPRSATITIDGFNVGKTPYLARLSRKDIHLVKLELPGYQPYEVTINRKLDGWIFGNIVLGGIVGIVVDVATGSMYRLTPKDIDGTLKSNTLVSNTSGDGLYFAVTLTPDKHWEKIGQLQPSADAATK